MVFVAPVVASGLGVDFLGSGTFSTAFLVVVMEIRPLAFGVLWASVEGLKILAEVLGNSVEASVASAVELSVFLRRRMCLGPSVL